MAGDVRRRVVALERAHGVSGRGGDSPWCQCAREYSVSVVWTVEGEPEPPAEVCSVCGRPIRRVTWDDIELAPQSEVV